MNITDFIRKWGANAALVRSASGELSLHDRKSPDPMMAIMALDLADLDEAEPRVARVRHALFTHDFDVSNGRNFHVNPDPVLSTTLSGQLIEKMSWNPLTGEALLVWPGQFHSSVKGRSPFDDYVRVVILQRQRRVTFRPFMPSWVKASAVPMDEADVFELSYDAQEACEKALRAAGASNWDFQMNVDNDDLRELSGRGGW